MDVGRHSLERLVSDPLVAATQQKQDEKESDRRLEASHAESSFGRATLPRVGGAVASFCNGNGNRGAGWGSDGSGTDALQVGEPDHNQGSKAGNRDWNAKASLRVANPASRHHDREHEDDQHQIPDRDAIRATHEEDQRSHCQGQSSDGDRCSVSSAATAPAGCGVSPSPRSAAWGPGCIDLGLPCVLERIGTFRSGTGLLAIDGTP